MKRIKYKYVYAKINHGTEEQPDIEYAFVTKHIPYSEENLIRAKEEAHNGEVEVEEVEDPETPETPDDSVWDELDAAYQEGVDSV